MTGLNATTPDLRPSAIGGYEDWPAFTRASPVLSGDPNTTRLARLLGVRAPVAASRAGVRTIRTWSDDGVLGEELEWHTGFGPPTRAWRVSPVGRGKTLLPGVLGLHCHAGVKWVGGERLVRTDTSAPEVERVRLSSYGGESVATDLARRGHVVLCHDTFAWGSRRFDLTVPPWRTRDVLEVFEMAWRAAGLDPSVAERYNVAAAQHEATIAKVAGLLGTSFAGTVAHDDLVALDVLASSTGVDPERLGIFGFSGGGGRAAILGHLAPRVRASAIVCMMTTFDALIPAYVDAHSWLLNTPGLAREIDWPGVAAARAVHAQLVLYASSDPLFPPVGMAAADRALGEFFADGSGTYRGVFVPGGHRFDRGMQATVADFLSDTLN